jgi:hypothetical protein
MPSYDDEEATCGAIRILVAYIYSPAHQDFHFVSFKILVSTCNAYDSRSVLCSWRERAEFYP